MQAFDEKYSVQDIIDFIDNLTKNRQLCSVFGIGSNCSVLGEFRGEFKSVILFVFVKICLQKCQ